MFHFMPPSNEPGPAAPGQQPAAAASLHLLETWLQEECDWVSELTRELTAVQSVIGLRFLDESEALLREHRNLFRQLLPRLLELEYDISGLWRQFEEFDSLSEDYRALVSQLKARL